MSQSLGVFKFQELLADQPDLDNPLVIAQNVIPRQSGYQSLNELLSYTDALDSRAMGAISAKDRAGNSFSYAGDNGKLYRVVDGVWTDSSLLVPYDAATENWEFARIGQQVIGVNSSVITPLDNPQVITFGGTVFAELTSLLQAKHVAAIRQFLVFANTSDAVDGHVPERVRWSAFGDITDFVIDPQTQSDFQDLESEGGSNQAIVGGEIGIIFQERSTWRMTYVGPPTIWQFDEVDPGIGTLAPGSVVQHGPTFFLAEDGFRITRGDLSEAIGEEKIDRTVLADLDQTFINRVTASVDVDEGIIYWAYPGSGNIGGTPNKLVIYNPAISRWSLSEDNIDILFQGSTSFRSIDGLDALFSSIDQVVGSLDDKTYTGGTFQVSAFGPDFKANLFNGPPRPALLETGEIQLEGRQTFVSGVRPLVDSGVSRIRVGHRLNLEDPVQFTDFSLVNSSGFSPFRVSSRFMRAQVEVTTAFKDAVGLEVFGLPAGRR